jgi:hypothetical protein
VVHMRQSGIAIFKQVRNHAPDAVVHVDFLFRLFDAELVQIEEIFYFGVI